MQIRQYSLRVRAFVSFRLSHNPSVLPARAILNIVEYYVNLDLAQLSAIVDKDLLASLQARPINMALDSIGDFSAGN